MAKRRRPNPSTKQQRKAPDASRAEKVLITPELAKEWLESNTENRPESNMDVLKISRAIDLGQWKINGETIKFDERGILRDGQTRLQAIVRSGKGVWCWIVWDIEPGALPFETIDIGRKRTLGHMLSIRGHKNCNQLAAAIHLIYCIDVDIVPEPGGFTPGIGLHVLEERPEIADSVAMMMGLLVRDIWSINMAAGLHHLMRRRNPELADKYWEGIGTGVITNKRSPMIAVRDVLLRNKNASIDKRCTPTKLQAIAIKGWLLFQAAKTCTRVTWDSEREAFPCI